ncbi:MAG TPA: SDR family NAD(P)-dependent oxidoreductase [Gemmataceae bacterium]|jgi:NADP-dependent 3-hydroxy acid dehydrogenase YdfG|nr:SDR family NAD(P)-dependent oxidoreductase [Gemmataceae bacterium]
MGQLDGRTALITGGGSGVGLATARLFLNEGARIAICGRNADKLKAAVQELAAGNRLLSFSVDVTAPKSVADMVAATTRTFGRIDILVNNAGMNIKERSVKELTPESWRLMVAANLDGAFYCIHAILPQMRERKDGIIININSVAGKRSGPLGGASYNAAKFGLSALGICVAAEEKDNNIRVCNIYPGEIDTPILINRPVPVTEEQRKKILQSEDVAAAVLFVAAMPARVSIPELVIKPTTQLYV